MPPTANPTTTAARAVPRSSAAIVHFARLASASVASASAPAWFMVLAPMMSTNGESENRSALALRGDRAAGPPADHPPEAKRRAGDGDTHDEPFEHGRGPPGDGRLSAQQIRHRHQAERGEHDGDREWDPTRAAQ